MFKDCVEFSSAKMIAQDSIRDGEEQMCSLDPGLDEEFQHYILTIKVNVILYEHIS